MRLIQRAVLAAIVTVLPVANGAKGEEVSRYLSGNDLLQVCRTSTAFCYGYVVGVYDANQAIGWPRTVVLAPRPCLSRKVDSSQIGDVVRVWLEKNPAQRHMNAAGLTIMALVEAFPCKKN